MGAGCRRDADRRAGDRRRAVVGAASAAHVAYAPESPAAAIDRMLARRAPVTVAPLARPTVDPLDPHFHAALWSDDARAAQVVTSTTLRTAKAR
jgi:hypothetical protein